MATITHNSANLHQFKCEKLPNLCTIFVYVCRILMKKEKTLKQIFPLKGSLTVKLGL